MTIYAGLQVVENSILPSSHHPCGDVGAGLASAQGERKIRPYIINVKKIGLLLSQKAYCIA